MEEKQWVILQGPLDQAKKFPSNVLKLDPREASEFPYRNVCLACRILCSPQKGTTAITHLSFVVEVILIERAGFTTPLMYLDHHPHHPLSGIPHPEPHSCCTEASRKVREGKEGLLLPPVTCEHRPILTLSASSSFFGRFFLTCSSFPLMSKMFSF